MRLAFFLFFFFITGAYQSIFSQTPIYKHFTVNDGLPSSIVYDVIQDKKGYIWVATENGVARYDGNTFETFTSKNGLADNVTLRLFADSKGRIWFFGLNGKNTFFYNDSIYNASNSPILAKFPDYGIVLRFLENDGKLYFFMENNRALLLEDDKVTTHGNWRYEKNRNFSVAYFHGDVYNFGTDQVGFMYVKNKTYHFYSNEGVFKLINSNADLILSHDKIPEKGITHKQTQIGDDLWICIADKGVTKVSNLSGDPTIRNFLPGKKVTGVCKDHEGNVWFGTEGTGLWLMPANSEKIRSYKPSDGLPEVGITVLHKDAKSNIWMGTGNGELFKLKNGKPVKYGVIPKTKMINEFYDMWSDNSGYFYLATNKYFVKWKENEITSVLQDKDITQKQFLTNFKAVSGNKNGKIAAATRVGLYVYNPGDNLGELNKVSRIPLRNNKRIFTIHVSNNNKIWIANNKGLGYMEGDSFVSVSYIDHVLASPISKIIEMPDGNLILSTRNFGIVLFNGKKVVQVVNTKNGLPSDICNKISLNGENIWVATHAGVAKLQYKNKRLHWLRNYTTHDGLLSNEAKDVVSTGDSIYVAFTEGLSVLKDEKNKFSSPPPLYIKSVIYNNNDISKTADSSVYYAQSFTRFTFAAITFQHPEKVIYKYRLLGADTMWQTNTNGSVDYATLKPGEYTFQVCAKTLNSNWSKIESYSFKITAPFWLQPWFSFALYALGLIGAGFGIHTIARQQRKRKEKKLHIQNRMVQLEQQALAALMNPHFIFNALNSIQQYLHNNDTLSANKYLSLFAKLTRRNMEAVMKSEVTLDDELERLELYLQFEKLRFGEKLSYHIIIPV